RCGYPVLFFVTAKLKARRRTSRFARVRRDIRKSPTSGSPSAVLLARQPVGQGHRLLVRPLGAGGRLLGGLRGGGALRLGCLARKPQRLQLRHIVEHGLGGGVAFGLAGSRVLGGPCHLVGACLGAITIFFRHFRSASFRGLGLGLAFDCRFRRVFTVGRFL